LHFFALVLLAFLGNGCTKTGANYSNIKNSAPDGKKIFGVWIDETCLTKPYGGDLLTYRLKFEYPHPTTLAKGDWATVIEGLCDLKGGDRSGRHRLAKATLLKPILGKENGADTSLDIATLDQAFLSCEQRGGSVIVTWGDQSLAIDMVRGKATYTTGEGISAETTCRM
jgi:hypothetical protein